MRYTIILLWSLASVITMPSKAHATVGKGQQQEPFPPAYWIGATAIVSTSNYVVKQTARAKREAEALSEQYYPGKCKDGEIGDAYRHVLVSLLLRKYLNRPLSAIIMRGWEGQATLRGKNSPRNKYMDLHNNRIGRVEHFKEIIESGHDCAAWAKNLFVWFESEAQLSKLPWEDKPPEKRAAKKQVDRTAASAIIYWAP